MLSESKSFDVIVVGSGPAGSMAVKELTERGLEVLLLEAGRDLTDHDFDPADKSKKFVMGPSLLGRMKGIKAGQYIQSLRAVYAEQVNHLLVNDRENPYTMPWRDRFLWIRGRVLGGRLNTYGRVLMRMSDYDFKAASIDGQGADWPISYDELAPYYDRVEEFIGVYGNADGVATVPDGKCCGAPFLSLAELALKETVERRWPGRRVISWRYAAPNLDRVPKGIAAAKATGLARSGGASAHRRGNGSSEWRGVH